MTSISAVEKLVLIEYYHTSFMHFLRAQTFEVEKVSPLTRQAMELLQLCCRYDSHMICFFNHNYGVTVSVATVYRR